MKPVSSIKLLFLAVILIGAAVMIWSLQASGKNNASKETMESCSKPEEASGKMIWEDLPQQFFSSF